MTEYVYRPLPKGSIRLLRIKQDADDSAPVECQLFDAPVLASGRAGLYEALSYVWGSGDKPRSVRVNGCDFSVGQNLHAALVALRDPVLDRIVWIDAVCINQGDDIEKGHQVQAMAKIYAKAKGVVVWLGPSTAESERAFRFIKALAFRKLQPESDDPFGRLQISKADVLDLIQRPWFKRIWVLQEVAAARHIVVKSGADEVSGDGFCAGLEKLGEYLDPKKDHGDHADGKSKIRDSVLALGPVTRLMKGSGLRPPVGDNASPRYSINVAPLVELVSLYQGHEATNRLDKIYALLGMSSDDPGATGLVPDYTISWEKLMNRFIDFAFSGKALVDISHDKNTAVIRAKGYVLSSPDFYSGEESGQTVDLNNIVCSLEGMAMPTLVTCHGDYSTVVQIATRLLGGRTQQDHPRESNFSIDFLLVWDLTWSAPKEKGANREPAMWFMETDVAASIDITAWKGPLMAEARALSAAMIVYIQWLRQRIYAVNLQLPGWALGAVQAAVDRYQTFLTSAPGGQRGPDSSSDCGTAGRLVILSLIISLGTNPVDFDYQFVTTDLRSPLLLAASTQKLAVVERILDCPDPEVNGLDELRLAVRTRYEAAVAGLMATKKLNPWLDGGRRLWGSAAQIALQNFFHNRIDRLADLDLEGSPEGRILQTFIAMDDGIRQVLYCGINSSRPLTASDVRFLLEKLPFDLNSQDSEGKTLFMVAVCKGHFEITKYLLSEAEASQHPCHARDSRGRTPLMMAAERGYPEVVKLLLASGESMPNSTDKDGLTALVLAASGVRKDDGADRRLKFEQTFSILMKHEGVQLDLRGNDGRTVLMLVMRAGWAVTVKHLLQTDAVRSHLNAQDSKGRTALLHALLEGKQWASVMEEQIRANPKTVPCNNYIQAVSRAAVYLLQDDQTDIDVTDNDGNSALSLLKTWPPAPRGGMELGQLENDWNRNKLRKYMKHYARTQPKHRERQIDSDSHQNDV